MDKQPDMNKLERVAEEAEVSKGKRTRTAPHVWKIGAATAIDNPRATSLSFAFFSARRFFPPPAYYFPSPNLHSHPAPAPALIY
jgi:hypothetical protein